MSPTIGSAWPPAASISSAAVKTVPGETRYCGSPVVAISATLAPSRAARSAISKPIPRLPPEMNRVLSVRASTDPDDVVVLAQRHAVHQPDEAVVRLEVGV